MSDRRTPLDKSAKNTKKSKHGKKNWRKNIDISELEKKNLKKDQEMLIERDVQFMKDDELFQIDDQPMQNVKNSFLTKKTQRGQKKNKISKNEERKIKRIADTIKGKEEEEKSTS